MRRAGPYAPTASTVALPVPALVTPPLELAPAASCDTATLPAAAAGPQTQVVLSPAGTFLADESVAGERGAQRRRELALSIRQRIESRLGGRVRDLSVRVVGSTVVLEGNCATYYTKQLAQHAALAVLEDEQLDNAIAVGALR